ncbi:MAG: MerR family transcriptional regulator [Deltaproteobacteria bacterium]|nr:MerR family transcriptional regulator [Deltaproteobacteria bacterium]
MEQTLTRYRDRDLLLPDLVEAADRLLGEDAPDARTVRYYQTLGLVRAPSRYDGRKAVYGYHSLVQVLAVRLLQAGGHSLAQVQVALAGVPPAELEAMVLAELGQPAAPPPAPRPMISAELAPGVLVVLDPSRVPEPEQVLRRLQRSLHPSSQEPT